MAQAFFGTSGFDYPEWKPSFYPPDLPRKGFLEYYGGRFRTVELNNTFYRIPNAARVASWSAATPPDFRFVLKAPRRITHNERLSVPSDALAYFLNAASGFQQRLGALLFQLPPFFRCDHEKLGRFLDLLPVDMRIAFEFRHESWFTPGTYELLRDRSAALCVHDSDEKTTPTEETSSFLYLRLRRMQYPPELRLQWQQRIDAWVRKGMDVFAFVKHEDNPEAPLVALEFAGALDSMI